jgi:putative tryptophan/tyrosine transport system substrate-binding protein
MKRRQLLLALGTAGIAPRLVFAQAARKAVVVLYAGEEEDEEAAKRPFFDEMRRLGWTEGANIAYERHYGRGTREYMAGLAKSAASREPDLIYVTAANLALAVAKETRTVPVVFTAVSDPVAAGLVASLARPGGNVTGAFQSAAGLVRPRLELMREAFPQDKRFAVLLDRQATDYAPQKAAHEEAARAIGLALAIVEFTNVEAVERQLANFRRQGIAAAKLTPSVALGARRREIAEHAARNKVALVAHNREWAEAGALLTYGPESAEVLRRSAAIADRVLKGARPAETPVAEANKTELIVNRRTARQLGLALPQALVRRADRVID